MQKRLPFLITALLLLLAPQAGADTVLVKDKLGRQIEVTVPVKRAVFISLYEFIPALDLWDRVVGVNRWAFENTLLGRFEQLQAIPPVGTGGDVNIETIMALEPDLVIIWIYKPGIVKFMEKRGLKVIAVYPESLKELYQNVRLCGRLFVKERRSEEIISLMEDIFDLIRSRVSGIPKGKRRKVLWLWGRPTTVNGGVGVQHDIIRLIGGINPAQQIKAKHVDVSLEKIVVWNPDTIFIWGSAKYGPQDLIKGPQWAVVKAIKEGRVYKAPSWSTWSPRLALMALWMAKKTYPEVFSDICMRCLADSFYKKVFGIPFDPEEFN